MNSTTTNITMIPVESSQLEAYGYDAASNTLAIRFKGKGDKPGTLYHYRNVGAADWQAFSDAESKGSHFIRNIKPHADRYPYTRILESDGEVVQQTVGKSQEFDPTDPAQVAAWLRDNPGKSPPSPSA